MKEIENLQKLLHKDEEQLIQKLEIELRKLEKHAQQPPSQQLLQKYNNLIDTVQLVYNFVKDCETTVLKQHNFFECPKTIDELKECDYQAYFQKFKKIAELLSICKEYIVSNQQFMKNNKLRKLNYQELEQYKLCAINENNDKKQQLLQLLQQVETKQQEALQLKEINYAQVNEMCDMSQHFNDLQEVIDRITNFQPQFRQIIEELFNNYDFLQIEQQLLKIQQDSLLDLMTPTSQKQKSQIVPQQQDQEKLLVSNLQQLQSNVCQQSRIMNSIQYSIMNQNSQQTKYSTLNLTQLSNNQQAEQNLQLNEYTDAIFKQTNILLQSIEYLQQLTNDKKQSLFGNQENEQQYKQFNNQTINQQFLQYILLQLDKKQNIVQNFQQEINQLNDELLSGNQLKDKITTTWLNKRIYKQELAINKIRNDIQLQLSQLSLIIQQYVKYFPDQLNFVVSQFDIQTQIQNNQQFVQKFLIIIEKDFEKQNQILFVNKQVNELLSLTQQTQNQIVTDEQLDQNYKLLQQDLQQQLDGFEKVQAVYSNLRFVLLENDDIYSSQNKLIVDEIISIYKQSVGVQPSIHQMESKVEIDNELKIQPFIDYIFRLTTCFQSVNELNYVFIDMIKQISQICNIKINKAYYLDSNLQNNYFEKLVSNPTDQNIQLFVQKVNYLCKYYFDYSRIKIEELHVQVDQLQNQNSSYNGNTSIFNTGDQVNQSKALLKYQQKSLEIATIKEKQSQFQKIQEQFVLRELQYIICDQTVNQTMNSLQQIDKQNEYQISSQDAIEKLQQFLKLNIQKYLNDFKQELEQQQYLTDDDIKQQQKLQQQEAEQKLQQTLHDYLSQLQSIKNQFYNNIKQQNEKVSQNQLELLEYKQLYLRSQVNGQLLNNSIKNNNQNSIQLQQQMLFIPQFLEYNNQQQKGMIKHAIQHAIKGYDIQYINNECTVKYKSYIKLNKDLKTLSIKNIKKLFVPYSFTDIHQINNLIQHKLEQQQQTSLRIELKNSKPFYLEFIDLNQRQIFETACGIIIRFFKKLELVMIMAFE